MPPKNATQFFAPEVGGLFILKHLQKPLYMLQST